MIKTLEQIIPIIRPTIINIDSLYQKFKEVSESGVITNGKYCRELEKRVAQYIGVKNAVTVGSCTSALMLVLKSLKLTGEVVLPSFTFAATAHSLIWNRLEPVFIDCEPNTYNIDTEKIEELISPRTSAIIAVSIFGVPPDYDRLEAIAGKHNLKLITDAAHALGSIYKERKCGSFGDAEIFSLSPTKVITAAEGGIVTTNNNTLAQFIRHGRDYGKNSSTDDIDFVGLSARMSEFHAIVALANFEKIEELIARRNDLIKKYKVGLENLPGISFQTIPPNCRTSGNYMVIFVDTEKLRMSRDELFLKLEENNIQTKKYFYPPVHLLKAYEKYRNKCSNRLPVTEKASASALALPLYSHMEDETVHKICETIRQIHSKT